MQKSVYCKYWFIDKYLQHLCKSLFDPWSVLHCWFRTLKLFDLSTCKSVTTKRLVDKLCPTSLCAHISPRQEREGQDARVVHDLAQLQGCLGSVRFGNQSQPKTFPRPWGNIWFPTKGWLDQRVGLWEASWRSHGTTCRSWEEVVP